MRYRRPKIPGATFFFTVVTYQRNKILCHEANVALVKEAFLHVTTCHPFRIRTFVLLPDHIHCLWTLPENDNNYPMRWQLIKSYFSKRCRNKYKGTQTASRLNKGEQGIWQRRFWKHQIRDENDLVRHIDYIHYNPVKHGLVNSPIAWPYSSFKNCWVSCLNPTYTTAHMLLECHSRAAA